MKPLLPVTLLFAVCVLACTSPVAPQKNVSLQKEDTMSTIEKNKAAIRGIYDCLNSRNYEQLRTYIADDYTGPGGHGADKFLTPVRPIITAFPDVRWTIEDLVAEENKITVRWRWKGVHTGTFYGVAPTNKEFTNDAIAIYELRNGQVVNVQMVTDRLGFLMQLGLVSPDVIPAPPVK